MGKNLINPYDYIGALETKLFDVTYNNGIITINFSSYNPGDRYCGFVFPVTPLQVYTVSWSGFESRVYLETFEEKPTSHDPEMDKTIESGQQFIAGRRSNWAVLSFEFKEDDHAIMHLQAELGDSATDYEPYSPEGQEPEYFSRICYLLSVIIGSEEFDENFQPVSRAEEILTCKIKAEEYTGDLLSPLEKLFAVWCGFNNKSILDFYPMSRSEKILWSKIFGTEYEGAIMSEVEELLIAL